MKALRVKNFLVVAAVVAMSSCASTSANDELGALREQRPDPELSPREVVEIQLAAFGSNNADNDGIAIGFRFASPANRAMTGPVDRFASMLQAPAYSIMLEYERIEFGPERVNGDRAVQRVALFSNDRVIVYDFYLRRQQEEPYVDCWMTEAVQIVGARGGSNGASSEVI